MQDDDAVESDVAHASSARAAMRKQELSFVGFKDLWNSITTKEERSRLRPTMVYQVVYLCNCCCMHMAHIHKHQNGMYLVNCGRQVAICVMKHACFMGQTRS